MLLLILGTVCLGFTRCDWLGCGSCIQWRRLSCNGEVTSTKTKDVQKSLEGVHAFAFHKVCEVIDNEILEQKKMKRFSDLRTLYVSYLQHTEFSNPEYQGDKLKEKLLKQHIYSECLSFCPLSDSTTQFHGYIVYNSTVTINEAIRNAYRLGSSDITQECGNLVHDAITETYKKTEELKWPPSANDLENSTFLIPSQLEKLLSFVINKQATPVNSVPKMVKVSCRCQWHHVCWCNFLSC